MARAKPEELMRETTQKATELELSTNTCMKYSRLMMLTAKLPRIPAVCKRTRSDKDNGGGGAWSTYPGLVEERGDHEAEHDDGEGVEQHQQEYEDEVGVLEHFERE